MGFIKEFKQFAVKGNVIDMAVGVIIGAAFGKIISSLVENIIMPPLSYMLSGVDFTELEYVMAEQETGPDGAVLTEKVAIEYGQFLQATVNFILVALVIFLFIKGINRLKKKAEDPKNKEVETPRDIALLAEIRDLLKEKS